MKRLFVALLVLALVFGLFLVSRQSESNAPSSEPSAAPAITADTGSAERPHASIEPRPIEAIVEAQAAPASLKPPAVKPTTRGSIHGRVAERSGEALTIPNVSVVLQRGGTPKVVPLSPTGTFDVDDLGWGTWEVKCAPNRYRPVSASVTLTKHDPRVQCDLQLELRTLLVLSLQHTDGRPWGASDSEMVAKVTPQLRPFLTSSVVEVGDPPLATGEAIPFRSRTLDSDREEGWCELDFETWDPLHVGVAFGGVTLACENVPIDTGDLALRISEDDIRRACGSLRVSVTDAEDGQEVTFPYIQLSPSSTRGKPKAAEVPCPKFYSFLAPGGLDLLITSHGYVQARRSVIISSAETAVVLVALERAITISGVLSSTVPPSPSGFVVAISAEPDRRQEDKALRKIGAGGAFEFTNIERGEYLVMDYRLHGKDWVPADYEKASLREGVVYVDAREGSVSGIAVPRVEDPARHPAVTPK